MKNFKQLFFLILLVSFGFSGISQNSSLTDLTKQLDNISKKKDSIEVLIEKAKLDDVIFRIHKNGLPDLDPQDTLICHSAMCMVFSSKYRLAKWVAHIITSDVVSGRISRTNNFRMDPKVPYSGNDSDYFSTSLGADNKIKYKGFGYDRGHLAPSADFRWSAAALSESYYYSNMTPQTPEFNREKWAEIEGFLRSYIYNNPGTSLYVVTGPVLRDSLPVIAQGARHLPIPEYHYKIAVDLENKIGIAFLVPQRLLIYPIESYAVSIDSIEKVTKINYFASLSADDEGKIESIFDFKKWVPEKLKNNVAPMLSNEMPKNAYNTAESSQFIDYPKEVEICGTVVSAHKSAKGNVFINLDKGFPNQVFSITIWAKDVLNFDYQPELFFMNKRICVTGKITEYNGTPSMYLSNQKKIKVID